MREIGNVRSILGIGLLALVAGCGGGEDSEAATGTGGQGGHGGSAAPPPLSYAIDPSIAPMPAAIGDGKGGQVPLGAVRDAAGTVSKFALEQVLIAPKNQSELEAFLTRHGGKVIGDNAVPPPPAALGIDIDPSALNATEYVVEVDPTSVSLATFVADAAKAGIGGDAVISSELAAKLLALVTHETAAGLAIGPNFAMDAADVMPTTSEAASGGGFLDGLSFTPFSSTGGKSRVDAALQFVAAQGAPNPTRVAIIDSGFWLDAQGRPLSTSGMLSDLPANPAQWDFVADDPIADGESVLSCSGGSLCRWHGNDCASVATGTINNKYGAVGTGGLVATPLLFKAGGLWGHTAAAIRAAGAWGADVVSMSFGGECDNIFCDAYLESVGIYPQLRGAHQGRLVLVAAAGNDGASTHSVPCRSDHVICVGALADKSNTAMGYSNHGPFLDIWAPTNIPAMPRPNDSAQAVANGNDVNASGTSASAPFVAGIAAMVRAYDKSLDSDGVLALLQKTGWTDSPDPKVKAYINAYEAVRVAAGGGFSPDMLEPNDSKNSATALGAATAVGYKSLRIQTPADKDYLQFSSDFAQVTIDTVHTSHIGQLAVALTHDAACGYVTQTKPTKLGTGTSSRTYRVSPDSWSLLFSSFQGALSAYDLSVKVSALALLPDTWEGYGGNEQMSAAAPVQGAGSYEATLHATSDVDWYQLTNSGSGGGNGYLGFVFSVYASDMPVSVHLVDAGGTEIKTASVSSDCQTPATVTVPVGTYFARVDGAKRGAYTFSVGDLYAPPKPIGSIKFIRKIDMLGPDPQSFLLTGAEELYRATTNIDMNVLNLKGTGVHLRVRDLAGTVLLEGAPTLDAAGEPAGESVGIGALAGTEFLIEVGRVADESMTSPVALPFKLALQHL